MTIFMGAEMDREHPQAQEDFSYLNNTVPIADNLPTLNNVPPLNNIPGENTNRLGNIPSLPLPPGMNENEFRRNLGQQNVNLNNLDNRLRRFRNSKR